MRSQAHGKGIFAIVLLCSAITASTAYSQTQGKRQAAPPAEPSGEKLNVQGIKEKYWAKGDENELRVVRNRLYTKEGKFTLGAFVGRISQDPFLDINNVGANVLYHISEYFSLGVTGWRSIVRASSALEEFERQQRTTVNNNHPKSYIGAEVTYSPLYGKLSLLGEAIIYFDIFVIGGLGRTDTEAGSYITPTLGIGQQVYLTQNIGLKLDYRTQYYKEDTLQKAPVATYLQKVGERTVFNHVLTLGLTLMLDI